MDALYCKNDDTPFPQVLQEILSTSKYQSIAHWLPDGLSFIISDKQRFSDEIIPKHFRRVAMYNSFIRKLNRYGFRRIKSPHKGEESSFAHVNFVREKPWLCSKIKCNFNPKTTYHRHKAKAPSAKPPERSLDNAALIRENPLLCSKMKCNSKPTYHEAKAPSAKQNAHVVQVAYSQSLDNAALLPIPIPIPTKVSQSFLTTGRMMDASRIYAPSASLPAGRIALQPMAATTIDPLATAAAAAAASAIQERHLLASVIPEHLQQRIVRERQILMFQRHQRQVQLQRLLEISALNDARFLSHHVAKQRQRMEAASRKCCN